MNMKRLSLISIAVVTCEMASAQIPAVDSYDVVRHDNSLRIEMTIAAPDKMKSNREVVVTPVLRSLDSSDSLLLAPVTVAGRSRYFTIQRHSLADPASLYQSKQGLKIPYAADVKMDSWMEHSQLDLKLTERGCCGDSLNSDDQPMALLDFRPREFAPALSYIRPVVSNEPKTRTINGSAYIDFPVNITEIRPSYRRNPIELAKINATIDSVRLDEDINIDAVTIKGYASPEGSYSNNTRLASGRTQALKEYVQMLHKFTPGLIKTSWEPEDWGGLKRYVEGSGLAHRDEILAIIDTDMDPDAKDAKIKRTYPEEYRFLLMEVYPALRHSDYTIDYTIRTFTDPEEILRLVKTAPQKLSLNEFYIAAATLEQGSPEYEDLWETAVRMYPDSEVALINAANAALSAGHLKRAEECLAKAGNGPDAIYTRGNLAALNGDLDLARQLFAEAARMKVADAPAALERINQISDSATITRLMK